MISGLRFELHQKQIVGEIWNGDSKKTERFMSLNLQIPLSTQRLILFKSFVLDFLYLLLPQKNIK